MTVGDWAQAIGTILGALIGVIGLAIVLTIEQRSRYSERLDVTLSEVILALKRRGLSFDGYTARDRSIPGGPPDADLQAAVEIAWMASRRQDRTVLMSIGDTTFNLKRGLVSWQIGQTGVISAIIRRWRTGETDREQTIAELKKIEVAAVQSGDAYDLTSRAQKS